MVLTGPRKEAANRQADTSACFFGRAYVGVLFCRGD